MHAHTHTHTQTRIHFRTAQHAYKGGKGGGGEEGYETFS